MTEKFDPKTTEIPGDTEFFKLGITLTKNDGRKAPVEFLITYPKGQGIDALEAMTRLKDYAPSVGVSLAQKGDPSVLAAMNEAGVSLDDTDDEGNQS